MLTYGGVPLLLPDGDGELQHWTRQYQDIADLVLFGESSMSAVSPRRGLLAWGGERKGVGQAVANYAAAPPPRLNTLYWPTGATRWARGYFVVAETQKKKIVAMAHGGSSAGNTALSLKWGDPDHKTPLQASMYLLPPRLVARSRDSDYESLWLLPLVDDRYWWQFKDTDDLEIDDEKTWAGLFSDIGTAIGSSVSLPTATAAAYLSPDPYEFTRRFENAAMMLDAAALSVGKRIVRRLDGAVRAESFGDTDTVYKASIKLPFQLLAGGLNSSEYGDQPAKVLATFRKWRHYRLLQKGQVYTVEKDATTADGTRAGATKVFHSTLHADYSSDSSPPANSSAINAITEAIRDDYYGWFTRRYDLTFAGAHPWQPCGFDDSIIWDFSRQLMGGTADGTRLGQTRVQSMPVDFGFDLQLSQDPEKTLLESPVLGKISGSSISKGARGTVKVWQGRSDARSDSGIEIDACASAVELSDNDKLVAGNWVDDDWEVGPWECQ